MPSGFRTLEFSDLDRKTIDAWRSQGIVFLVGSLVSGYPPTNLPLGSEISSALCKWLFPEFPDWLQQDVKRLPFEALMELYPDQSALPSIVKTVFNFDTLRPNKVHSTLASSLLEDKIRGLITTNYDLGFEVCFRENPRVSTVDDRASFERYRSADSKQAIYLKLHGTAKAGKEHTLVYKLTHEGRLQDWKKDLLRELLQDRVLVVAGYSGCDFDICPVLARETGQRLTVWLQRPDKPQDRQEPQANARRVVENRDGFFLAADFIDFLEEVLDKRCEDCLALGRRCENCALPEHQWDAEAQFRRDLIKQWRLQILNWMACGELGRKHLSDFTGAELTKRKFRARIMGHLGRYHDAVAELEANLREPGLSEFQKLECRISLAGARFIYGQHLRGVWSLRRVRKGITTTLSLTAETRKALVTEVLETEMMMYMRMAQILHLVRCGWFLTFFKEELGERYDGAREYLEKTGEWGRLEALQINAERIGIARHEGLPLPSREGFRSLGLISMEVIAVRDMIRSTQGRLADEMERMAYSCLDRAEQYGWHHEAWKFHWILLWRGHQDKKRHLAGWWNQFWEVQYAPLARILQLALNLVPAPKGA